LAFRDSLLTGCRDLEVLGEQFIGAQPLVVVVDVGGDHDFVCHDVFGERLESLGLLEDRLQGETPMAPVLWNQTGGSDSNFRR
jgi:hypothetical protein